MNYDDLINYINQFYDYNIIEEHYKDEQKNVPGIILNMLDTPTNTTQELRIDNMHIDATGRIWFDTEM